MKGWNDFIIIKKILDEMGVPFFVHSGSALGVYRDKQIIVRGSNSIGIGIIGMNRSDDIKNKMIDAGFRLKETFSHDVDLGGGIISRIDLPLVGLIEFYKESQGMIYFFFPEEKYFQSYLNKDAKYVYFPLEFNIMSPVDINDTIVYIPGPTPEYLSWVFGPDWETPKDTKSYPPCQKP